MTIRVNSKQLVGASPHQTMSVAIGIVLIASALSILSIPLAPTDSAELVLWGTSFCVAAWAAFRLRSNNDKMDPYYSLIVLYGLYAWSAAGYAVWVLPGTFDSVTLREYYIAIHLGLLCFVVGYQIIGGRSSGLGAVETCRRSRLIDRRFGLSLAAAMLVCVAVVPNHFAAFDIRNVQAYTDVAASWRLDLRGDAGSGVRSYLNGLPLLYATALLMFLSCRLRSTVVRCITGALLCYIVALAIMRGEKAAVLAVGLLIALFSHYRRRPIRISQVVVPALVMYVFAVMISHVRNTTSIIDMLSAGATLVAERPEVLLPIHAGELNGPPQTLLVVIDDIRTRRTGFLGAQHYQDELRVWIPRALDKDRPRPLSEQYMERFFQSEDDEGRGHGMFILTPGYWALGFVGVAMEMMIYGMIVAAMYRGFRRVLWSDAGVLVYSQCMFVLAFMAVRTGFLGSVRASAMAAVPFVPLLIFASGGLARRPAHSKSVARDGNVGTWDPYERGPQRACADRRECL
jgi:hypothetical protein